MAEDKQIELELDESNDVEVEVKPDEKKQDVSEVVTETTDEDQFKKAESATQKRKNSLTK